MKGNQKPNVVDCQWNWRTSLAGMEINDGIEFINLPDGIVVYLKEMPDVLVDEVLKSIIMMPRGKIVFVSKNNEATEGQIKNILDKEEGVLKVELEDQSGSIFIMELEIIGSNETFVSELTELVTKIFKNNDNN